MNLANFISLGRLFLVPLIVWFMIEGQYFHALIFFIIAGISDILDGLAARLLEIKTEIGAFLDPIADKVLLMSMFITLGTKGWIPLWLVILVISRDVMLLGGTLLLMITGQKFRVQPSLISKINTLAQIVLVGIVLSSAAKVWCWPYKSLLWITVSVTTISSSIGYFLFWIKEINGKGQHQ